MNSAALRSTAVGTPSRKRVRLPPRYSPRVESTQTTSEFYFNCLFGEWELPGPVPWQLRAEALLGPQPFTFDASQLVELERCLKASSPLYSKQLLPFVRS
jgi:hypothetical protein